MCKRELLARLHVLYASWLCMDEAEWWCVYSPNTPAVSAERVVGSLPGIHSSCNTHAHTHARTTHTRTHIVYLFEYGLREISQHQSQAEWLHTDFMHTNWGKSFMLGAIEKPEAWANTALLLLYTFPFSFQSIQLKMADSGEYDSKFSVYLSAFVWGQRQPF